MKRVPETILQLNLSAIVLCELDICIQCSLVRAYLKSFLILRYKTNSAKELAIAFPNKGGTALPICLVI